MQQLHFVTTPSAGSHCALYALELSAILRDAGLPVEHWLPRIKTDANALFLKEAITVDPGLKENETLGRALVTPTNTEEVQNFSREIGSGIIVLSATLSEELPNIMAFLRARIGRKLILVLHNLQDHPNDNLLQAVVRLCHLLIVPTYLDLTALHARGIQTGEVFAVPLEDDYPSVFVNAVQTSPRLQAPLVSVIVTCYNQEAFIGDALRSLQTQTIDSWEAILVDDHSEDGSLDAISPFISDSRIKGVSMEANSGPSVARNVGLQQMHPYSEYVVLLDGDDLLEPGHMEHLITTLVQDATLVGTYGQLTFVDKDNVPSKDHTNIPMPTPLGDRLTGQMMATSCWIYPPSAAIFHKWAVNVTGPFNPALRIGEDWEWIARCLTHGDMQFTQQKVVRYRLHDNNSHRSENYVQKTLEAMQKYTPSLIRASFRDTVSPTLLNRDVLQYNREQEDVRLVAPQTGAKIGVVVAAYNAELYLKATLTALKKQTFAAWECVVVNDGSTDKTWDVIKPFLRDKRFKRHTQFNAGTATARNEGACRLSDDVTHLLFLDADDLLVPEALATLLSLMQAFPYAPAVFGLLEFIDEAGKKINTPDWYDDAPHDNAVDWYPWQRFASMNPIVTPGCALIDRRVWKAVGPFREDLKWIEDWGLWADISTLSPIARFRAPLLRYRKHGAQKTANPALHLESEQRGPALVTEAHNALATGHRHGWYYDPLLRTRVRLPLELPMSDRVICTVASCGYDEWLTGMLSSLKRHGNVPDVSIVVFNIGNDSNVQKVAEQWGALNVPVDPIAKPAAWSKSILYSAASLLQRGQIVCLDTDILVMGDISPLFTIIETCEQNSIFVVRDGLSYDSLRNSWTEIYEGTKAETVRLGLDGPLGDYKLTVNDGVMAGSCRAFLKLEQAIRCHYLGKWDILERQAWRNQIFSNLAMAELNCAVELPAQYNAQIHAHASGLVLSEDNIKNVKIFHRNRPVKLMHYTGTQKSAHSSLHTFYRGLTPDTALMKPEDDDEISV